MHLLDIHLLDGKVHLLFAEQKVKMATESSFPPLQCASHMVLSEVTLDRREGTRTGRRK